MITERLMGRRAALQMAKSTVQLACLACILASWVGVPIVARGDAPEGLDAGIAGAANTAADAAELPAVASTLRAKSECTDKDLLKGAMLTGEKVKGSMRRIRDGRLAKEGATWNGAFAITLEDDTGFLQVDLRSIYDLTTFVVQADNNDQYLIEGSIDGVAYTPVWVAPAPELPGLRTRSTVLSKPSAARYLRIKGVGGDGYYSLSEVRAYCEAPKDFPPKLSYPPKKHFWAMLSNPLMVHVQASLATAASFILLLGFLVPYPFRRKIAPHVVRDTVLFWSGMSGLLVWTYSGDWRHATAGAGVLLVWFLIRWASGDASSERKFATTAKALCRPPWSLFMAALLLAAIGGTYHSFGLVPACGALLMSVFLWALVRMLRQPITFQQSSRFLILALGLVGFSSWWNVGHFHFEHHIHVWEQYHYFVGAKYGPELRFARLYDCTAAADLLDGKRKRVEKRKIRQLATDNELGDAKAIIENPGLCSDYFTKERFAAFRKDIRFFRGRFSADRWDKSQTDHGYNATPVWGLLGRYVTEQMGDLTWRKIEVLGAVDNVLLVLMWCFAYWAFGFESAMVALMFWGFNYPGRYYWNGGGVLRYDWLLWLVVGIGFLKKKQNFLGGVFLTYTTLLRIFPGFVVAAIVLKALARMVRERRFVLSRAHTAFAAGCIITLGTLIPASTWSMNGLDAWGQFAQNSAKHIETALTNNMGLKTIVGYDYATRASAMRNDKAEDPFKGWKDARKYYYHKRMPIFLALIGLYCLLLARAGTRAEDWEVACLGTGLIVIASELTCYYYAFLLTFGLMWSRRKLPGLLMVAFAAGTAFMDNIPMNDDRYGAMSLIAVIAIVIATAAMAFGKSTLEPQQGPEVDKKSVPPTTTARGRTAVQE